MRFLLALTLALGSGSALADGADTMTVEVRGGRFEVRFLDALYLTSMYSGAKVSEFCRRKIGDEWENASLALARAAGGATTDVGAYYGHEALLKVIDQILKARLSGASGETMYIFQGRTTSGGYAYGWHYALQDAPPHLTDLYVALSAQSFGGKVDAYCARVLPAM